MSAKPALLGTVFVLFTWAAAVPARGGALPKLSISDVTVSESACSSQQAVFTVSVGAPFGKNATVQYATADGSAIAGTDYTAASGTLFFPRGSQASQTITVPITDVMIPGPDKTFVVKLSNPVNATVTKGQGTGTIQAPQVAKCQSCGVSCDDGDACSIDSCSPTLGCKHANGSAASTPYCVLSGVNGPPDPNFSACHASGEWTDTDGDGFSDAEEAQGYIDVNGNGVYDPGVDVPLPGADPHKPDVYVHYDYFYAGDHDHNPPAEAIQWLVNAFAAHGVNLHIDPQHNAIDEASAKVVTDQFVDSPDPSCVGPSAVTIHQLRQTYFPANFNLAYHYMVFSHWSYCDNSLDCNRCPVNQECGAGSPPLFGAYGESQIVGDDAIVSFGTFTDAGHQIPLEAWAGIGMHELGHNFGLMHGGGSCDNYKPNYLSTMSYNFYTTGIPVGASPGDTAPKSCTTDSDCYTGDQPSATQHCSSTTNTCIRLDFSSTQLLDLNESALDESKGLNQSAASTDISLFTTDGITTIYVPTNGTPIDWNQNGTIETGVMQDINGDGATTLLAGFSDWANLNYAYQCNSNYDSASQALAKPPFEQLLHKYWVEAAVSKPARFWVANTDVRPELGR